jgi:tetratricopeptide (TPR) repeat protein
MRGVLIRSLILTVGLAAPAFAQTYPVATAPPRTTDPATLRRLAESREIHERFTRGLDAERHGDWAAAAAQFERIVALDPPEPQGSTARYDDAIAETHLTHYDRAITLLRDALVRDPEFAAAAANLVTAAVYAGDEKTAREAADRFVAIAPASARARYQRGLVALQSGDLATARADFLVLVGSDPSYATAHYDLALVEIRDGKLDVAQTELERALELSPGYARARFALGTVFFRLGRRGEARAAFDRAAADASEPTLRELAISIRDQL